MWRWTCTKDITWNPLLEPFQCDWMVIWSTNKFMWESMGRNSRWKSIGKCAKCKWFTKYGGTWGWWRHSFWNRQVGGSHVNFHFKPCNDHVLHCLSHKGVGEGVGSDFFCPLFLLETTNFNIQFVAPSNYPPKDKHKVAIINQTKVVASSKSKHLVFGKNMDFFINITKYLSKSTTTPKENLCT